MKGVRYVVACMYPKAIHEGNGKVAVFIDDKAKPEQAEAMTMILSGQAGGMPWEALAGTITVLEGPVRKPIEMTVKGTRSSIRIPGVLELRQTPIVDAVSGQEERRYRSGLSQGGIRWDKANRHDQCPRGEVRPGRVPPPAAVSRAIPLQPGPIGRRARRRPSARPAHGDAGSPPSRCWRRSTLSPQCSAAIVRLTPPWRCRCPGRRRGDKGARLAGSDVDRDDRRHCSLRGAPILLFASIARGRKAKA